MLLVSLHLDELLLLPFLFFQPIRFLLQLHEVLFLGAVDAFLGLHPKLHVLLHLALIFHGLLLHALLFETLLLVVPLSHLHNVPGFLLGLFYLLPSLHFVNSVISIAILLNLPSFLPS